MYLSRLVLNMANRMARRDIASAYDLHRTIVTQGFAERESDPGRILFRIEPQAESRSLGGPVVLIQSTESPELGTLPDGYCLRVDGPRPFDPHLSSGMLLSFRLVANPIRKARQVDPEGKLIKTISGNQRHQRRGILDEESQRNWLERRGNMGGFKPRFVTVTPLPGLRRRLNVVTHDRKQSIPHVAVRFDGVLEVSDPKTMADTLANGIGAAKAFGCGLLSVARF